MKSAKTMFKELGYREYWEEAEPTDYIKFVREDRYGEFIIFHKRLKTIEMYDINVYFDHEHHLATIEELKAINQMVKELGWLDE